MNNYKHIFNVFEASAFAIFLASASYANSSDSTTSPLPVEPYLGHNIGHALEGDYVLTCHTQKKPKVTFEKKLIISKSAKITFDGAEVFNGKFNDVNTFVLTFGKGGGAMGWRLNKPLANGLKDFRISKINGEEYVLLKTSKEAFDPNVNTLCKHNIKWPKISEFAIASFKSRLEGEGIKDATCRSQVVGKEEWTPYKNAPISIDPNGNLKVGKSSFNLNKSNDFNIKMHPSAPDQLEYWLPYANPEISTYSDAMFIFNIQGGLDKLETIGEDAGDFIYRCKR